MSAICQLLGDNLTAKGGESVPTSSVCSAGSVVGLYFSAHWCAPCRGFTPSLAKWYADFKKTDKGATMEMVFVSSDRDEGTFKEYFAEMPWYALPYAERDKKNKLSKKCKVQGIPTLVFLEADTGKIITDKGRSWVTKDPEGKDFPWHPKPLADLLKGPLKAKADCDEKAPEGKFTDCDEKALEGKFKGIYFSAHWCPPCRAFTPQLVETYNKLKEDGKNFEITFVSSDRSQDAFEKYYGEMPWLAVPYGDEHNERKKQLSEHFNINGIPSLIILDENNEIITTNGRAAVGGDPKGEEFPWYPKPLNELNQMSISHINESACLILFTDAQADSEATKSLIREEAEAYLAAGNDPELFFFYAIENDENDIIDSLRDFANLEDRNPMLVIMDIPEQSLYVHPDGEITKEVIKKVVADYSSGEMKMQTIRG